MGDYTEFHFNAKLKDDVPSEILNLLKYMTRTEYCEKIPEPLPDHRFFKCPSWDFLNNGSYYFSAQPYSKLYEDDLYGKDHLMYFLCIRCSLTNYDNEIGHFLDWIKPYLNETEGKFLGFSRYEYNRIPNLHYMDYGECDDCYEDDRHLYPKDDEFEDWICEECAVYLEELKRSYSCKGDNEE